MNTNNKLGYREGVVSVVLNLLLFVLKYYAGIVSASVALIADAWHTLSDSLTSLVVIFGIRMSSRKPDKEHPFGHGRWEQISAIIIAILLAVVGLEFVKDSIGRLSSREAADFGWWAYGATLVSIIVKEGLAQYAFRIARITGNASVKADGWHHRSDAFSSIGTAIGIGGAILLGDSWRVLDPLAAVIVSVFIVQVAVKQLKSCVDELLERSLPDDIEQEITKIVLSEEGVSEPHHLRTRRIGSHYAMDMHVRMDGNIPLHEAHEKATAVERKLREAFGANTYISIHVEPEK